jgi:hypothetical protein
LGVLQSSSAGPPRQADLRRAVSTAYYALFHFVLTEAADEFAGFNRRGTKQYSLAYRSIDHRTLREVSVEVGKSSPSLKYRPYVPADGFDPIIREVALGAVELQQSRLRADYDPDARFARSDVQISVETARRTTGSFRSGDRELRRTFLALLLFPPR